MDSMTLFAVAIVCFIIGIYLFQMINRIIVKRQKDCYSHSWQHYRRCINCGLKQVQESNENE